MKFMDRTRHLQLTEARVSQATLDLARECEAQWPEGSTVLFVWNRRQITPSRGTIIRWRGGEAYVKTENVSRSGYPRNKWFHWSSLR